MPDEAAHIAALREDKDYHQTGKDNGCIFRECGKNGHKHRENAYDYAKANLKSYYNKNFQTGALRILADAVLGARVFGGGNGSRDPRSAPDIWHIDA